MTAGSLLLRRATRASRALAMWPIWTAQLATGAKSFGDNPLIGSARLNALGLHVARVRIAHRLAARRRRRLAPALHAEDRAALDRDGFLVKPDALPQDLFWRVRDEVGAYHGPAREMRQGTTTTRRIALDKAALARMPALREALALPLWRDTIRYAWSFDAEPIIYVQTILSGEDSLDTDPQCHLHADTFHPTVKAWLFLTDVGPGEAPFTYVPGSHRPTPARLAWDRQMSCNAAAAPDRMTRRGSPRISAESLPALGLPEPVALAVPANTLVVADTAGFHARGPSRTANLRVEIWAYGRRNPFQPWAGMDAWSMIGLADRRSMLFWRFRDALERLGLAKAVWRRRDGVGAFEE